MSHSMLSRFVGGPHSHLLHRVQGRMGQVRQEPVHTFCCPSVDRASRCRGEVIHP
ncbi:hypothetical protein [Ornithinimicrobium kibberense]|uniref:hypothetical protein n=1 Tax=Ornithinimicrobium kibberense TaxID=282060 RepID=UPI0036076C10